LGFDHPQLVVDSLAFPFIIDFVEMLKSLLA